MPITYPSNVLGAPSDQDDSGNIFDLLRQRADALKNTPVPAPGAVPGADANAGYVPFWKDISQGAPPQFNATRTPGAVPGATDGLTAGPNAAGPSGAGVAFPQPTAPVDSRFNPDPAVNQALQDHFLGGSGPAPASAWNMHREFPGGVVADAGPQGVWMHAGPNYNPNYSSIIPSPASSGDAGSPAGGGALAGPAAQKWAARMGLPLGASAPAPGTNAPAPAYQLPGTTPQPSAGQPPGATAHNWQWNDNGPQTPGAPAPSADFHVPFPTAGGSADFTPRLLGPSPDERAAMLKRAMGQRLDPKDIEALVRRQFYEDQAGVSARATGGNPGPNSVDYTEKDAAQQKAEKAQAKAAQAFYDAHPELKAQLGNQDWNDWSHNQMVGLANATKQAVATVGLNAKQAQASAAPAQAQAKLDQTQAQTANVEQRSAGEMQKSLDAANQRAQNGQRQIGDPVPAPPGQVGIWNGTRAQFFKAPPPPPANTPVGTQTPGPFGGVFAWNGKANVYVPKPGEAAGAAEKAKLEAAQTGTTNPPAAPAPANGSPANQAQPATTNAAPTASKGKMYAMGRDGSVQLPAGLSGAGKMAAFQQAVNDRVLTFEQAQQQLQQMGAKPAGK